MYYISKIYKNGEFGITDTDDGQEILLSKEQVIHNMCQGYFIHGAFYNRNSGAFFAIECKYGRRVSGRDFEKAINNVLKGDPMWCACLSKAFISCKLGAEVKVYKTLGKREVQCIFRRVGIDTWEVVYLSSHETINTQSALDGIVKVYSDLAMTGAKPIIEVSEINVTCQRR